MKRWIIRGCILGTLSLTGVSGAVLAQRYFAPNLLADLTGAAVSPAAPAEGGEESEGSPGQPPADAPEVVRGNDGAPEAGAPPTRPTSSFGFAGGGASRYGDSPQYMPEVSPAAYEDENPPADSTQPPARFANDQPPARLLPADMQPEPMSPNRFAQGGSPYAGGEGAAPLPDSASQPPTLGGNSFSGSAYSGSSSAESRDTAPPDFPRPSAVRYEPERRFQEEPLDSYRQPAMQSAAIAAPRMTPLASPGGQQLEGTQAPALVIEKSAPPEIQVGKPATFTTVIRNVGPVAAHDVVLADRVPQGTQLVDTTPAAQTSADGSLLWQLGTLEPGTEKTLSLQVMPQQEGELGSVATVMFQAQASVRSLCTKPNLSVEHTAPRQVLIGEDVTLSIKIQNNGTGAASGVVLEENVPEGLSHFSGHELEYEVGVLQPGESRNLELTLKAAAKGTITNILALRDDSNREVLSQPVNIEVIAPELEMAIAGPKRRYLQREATYEIGVLNPGTATAHNVQLVAHLPKGFRFVSASDSGSYVTAAHAIYWNMAQLPAAQQGKLSFNLLPLETGDQRIRLEGQADLGLTASIEQNVLVEGLAELNFQVADLADPIEVGNDTTYVVTVTNSGSKPATEVVVMAALPSGMEPLSGDGGRPARIEGQNVVFAPLPRLAPKEEASFRITVRGRQAGDHRIRVQVSSADTQAPVTKEESTRVYADQ